MKLCMGCMSEIEDQFTTCPYCGFNEAALQQESYYLMPGTVVGGKYIVGKVLRYGGHTVSYLGMDAEANRRVMVKEYLPSDFSTRSEGEQEVTIYSGDAKTQFEQGLTSFLNEANKLQSLGSMEGIARVYDCVSENDTGYVIGEYVEGRTLKEILASGKRYGVKEAVTLLSPVLRALERVHALHMIHCDISPETIMVADTGEAKLIDFGATRYVTTANSKSLAIILKQGYAPEEQYRSSGNRGSWTDVYAVAAVMYKMITGRTPQESVERALVDELKEPSKLGVSIPANLENALMNALNVYQKERTATAGAFLQELNAPSVKRIKTAKKKKETGKFPIWAKGLVAALLCVAVTGGFVVYKGMNKDGYREKGTQYVEDFKGKEYNDVENWFSDNQKVLPTDFIKKGYMYNSEEKEGTIVAQSIESDRELTSLGDDDKLIVYLASKEKTSCQDIIDSQMNALFFQQKLNLDDSKLEGRADLEGKEWDYYEISKIKLKDSKGEIKELSSNDIKDNSLMDIEISEIEKIEYYAGKFFCWRKDNPAECTPLQECEGKNIKDIKAPIYTKVINQENEYIYQGTGSLENSTLVDDSYGTYSSDWEEGDICEVTCSEDEWDQTDKKDFNNKNKILFKVIKESIQPDSRMLLSQIRTNLEKKFKKVEFWKGDEEYTGDPDKMELVIGKSKVVDKDGNQEEYFKIEDTKNLIYRIAVTEKSASSTQKPQSTNPPGDQKDEEIIDFNNKDKKQDGK